MRQQLATNLATYCLLGTAATVSILLPSELQPARATGNPPTIPGETTIQLAGVVRDFKAGHPDFGASISGGNGHYAGNVTSELTAEGRPAFVGVISTPVTDFSINNGATVPNVTYTPMITVIGAAVSDGGAYDCPVTVRLNVGSTVVTPWGAFDKAVAGNVNKSGNPRAYTHSSAVPASTPLWVEGRVFTKKSSSSSGAQESHWQEYSTFGSRPSNNNVKVLKNGDSVPNTSGFLGQISVRQLLSPYVNTVTKKVTLQSNQAIYLFEFGSTSGSAADWQDLVVLVTLGQTSSYLNTLSDTGVPPTVTTTPKGYKVNGQWHDGQGNPIPPHLFGSATGDIAGSKGAASTGGIYSSQSFDQWYADVMGVNLSNQVPITLTRKNNVWEYLTDAFHPIDDQLLGNESKSHNFHFTMAMSAEFTHHAGEHRFVEFQGDDDMWVFIDGKLAMDLGGIAPGSRQYVDVDRLGLSDGQEHRIEFFYAQRNEVSSVFRLRTNLDLGGGAQQTYAVSGVGD